MDTSHNRLGARADHTPRVIPGLTHQDGFAADESQNVSAPSPLACSVGIMAYNEAANIANAIKAILQRPLRTGHIAELIVVTSGCTDRTVPIVSSIAEHDTRVRLIVQERREGKASAINLFLNAARSPILLMVSADVVVQDGTIDALLRHFHDPAVGMVGGHPIPVNDEETFLGYTVHLLWRMHDRVAREAPKLGEVVAFRNVVPSIPFDTPVDEISIQAFITQLGYRLVYEPEAIVYNRGPMTIGDFLRQRRRIYAGHLRIRQQQRYAASTMSVRRLGRALLALDPLATPRMTWRTIGAVGLEATARGLGHYDYVRKRPHQVWQVVATTKPQIAEASSIQGQRSVLVFRIVGFHRHELELGAHASHLLTHQVMQHVRQALGSESIVSIKHDGIIIALLPTDREEAEERAQYLKHTVEAAPLRFNRHRDGVSVQLACGIIAFSQAGQALALSISATA